MSLVEHNFRLRAFVCLLLLGCLVAWLLECLVAWLLGCLLAAVSAEQLHWVMFTLTDVDSDKLATFREGVASHSEKRKNVHSVTGNPVALRQSQLTAGLFYYYFLVLKNK
jgi:hypothetical protein